MNVSKRRKVIVEKKAAPPVDLPKTMARIKEALAHRGDLLSRLEFSIKRLEDALQKRGVRAFGTHIPINNDETAFVAWRQLKPRNDGDVDARWRFMVRVETITSTQEVCLTDAPMTVRLAVAVELPNTIREILERQTTLFECIPYTCKEIDKLSDDIEVES